MGTLNRPTICWDCAKATGKCSWSSATHKPVKGWTAIQRNIHNANNDFESYIVVECPEFDRDAERMGLVRCRK